MLDKVFLQTRVLISRAKNTYPFLEAELVSSSNVSSFAFKLSTFLYIYTYTRVKNYGIKETGCDKYGKTQYHCHVNLRNSWPEFSYFRWKKIIATAIRRNSLSPQTLLFFTVLSRLITAATKMYRSPFSTTVAVGSHFLDSTWFPVSGRNGVFFLSKREIDVLSENTKGGGRESIRFENHPFKYGIIRWDVSRLGCISNISLLLLQIEIHNNRNNNPSKLYPIFIKKRKKIYKVFKMY